MTIYRGKSFSLNFRHPVELLRSKECLKFRLRLYFSRYLPARTECQLMYIVHRTLFVVLCKIKGFREKLVCVIVATFLFFVFADQMFLVDVFSQRYLSNSCQNTTMADSVKNR